MFIGARLLSLLGYKVNGLKTNIGLEQELFFIPRDAFMKRPGTHIIKKF